MALMGKRKRTAISIVAAAVAAAAIGFWLFYSLSSREPDYRGKRLTAWMEECRANTLLYNPHPELAQEAEAAVRRIGTNGLPIYVELIKTRESALKAELLKVLPITWARRLHVSALAEYRREIEWRRAWGASCLVALGEEAKPAVPALVRLLTDQDQYVRSAAIMTLGSLGPVASEAVPGLITCLRDPDPGVRYDAASTLGDIHQMPERAVPALVECLKEYRANGKDADIVPVALRSLGQFGAQARPVVAILRELLNDPDAGLRFEARIALQQIDAEAGAAASIEGGGNDVGKAKF
jgi:HEAT repeats